MSGSNDKFKCCFCGKIVVGEWGNNPAPACERRGAKCCDDCNSNIVIPVRLMALFGGKYENSEETVC